MERRGMEGLEENAEGTRTGGFGILDQPNGWGSLGWDEPGWEEPGGDDPPWEKPGSKEAAGKGPHGDALGGPGLKIIDGPYAPGLWPVWR